jgi:outer membrane lipopolysaccharide assembly protein LptE/RlpB
MAARNTRRGVAPKVAGVRRAASVLARAQPWRLCRPCWRCRGCGFRLAGSDPLPGVLARPYLSLKDPYTDFSREFEHQLKSAGATLQNGAREFHGDHRSDQGPGGAAHPVGVGANIPTEYELTYTVTFAVQGTDKELLAPQTISLSKDYSFEENVLLAKEHEADILRQQMARDLVSIAHAPAHEFEVAGAAEAACCCSTPSIGESRTAAGPLRPAIARWWRPKRSSPAPTGASARRA